MPRIRASSIKEHKELTRRQLLDSAQELFRIQGYEGTALGDVAALVGVGRTTIYEYFRDKEDLLASLVEETLPALIEDVVSSVSRGQPAGDQLAELASGMVEFVAIEPTLGVLLHTAVPSLSPDAQQRVRDAHEGLAAEFSRIYRTGVEDGDLRSLPPDVAGQFLQDLIMSAAKVLIRLPDPTTRLPEVRDAMRSVLLHGFSS